MTVLSDAQLHSARSTVNGPMTRSDRVATLEEAKARFQKNWNAWKAWAKLEEMPEGHQASATEISF